MARVNAGLAKLIRQRGLHGRGLVNWECMEHLTQLAAIEQKLVARGLLRGQREARNAASAHLGQSR